MTSPWRFVATSYNLWADQRWPEREEALRGYARLARPDVLCLQELRPATRDVLDQELPGHARVDDPAEGWSQEGTIYWSKALFDLVEYGAEEIGMLEPLRRLFWVRLRAKRRKSTVLVLTAHYTWGGNERERTEGFNPRLEQARRTVAAIDQLAEEDEPVIFMGDLNEASNAIFILQQDGGLTDSFTACGVPLQPTIPARPTADGIPNVLDWQFHRGPIRAMTSSVGDYFCGDIAPSDHKPVTVTYACD